VINIASDVGVISPDHRIYEPNPEHGYEGVHFNSPLSYATSKAALIHMTKFWATYWAKKGIRVNAISPAGVENNQDPKFRRELTDRIPLGRMAKPHEFKGAIVFLASEASSFMTGHNLIIDGGRTIW
ncbi:MAG: SDR family oxidoreductase, partial [Bdellovibrionota bacterium]